MKHRSGKEGRRYSDILQPYWIGHLEGLASKAPSERIDWTVHWCFQNGEVEKLKLKMYKGG